MINISKCNWNGAWKYHRQEFLVWMFAVIFYYLFMKEAEPSKYTSIIWFLIIFIPPFTAARIVITAVKGKKGS
ncbi:hypothetical protein SAMN04515695_0178 [Pseudovibrio sp. Tun.PSC04-5.I4]|nr:hypothetical protein SAMN04515695_0178 [Pseudovibrio sp. Tun.PSC04-5.I4]